MRQNNWIFDSFESDKELYNLVRDAFSRLPPDYRIQLLHDTLKEDSRLTKWNKGVQSILEESELQKEGSRDRLNKRFFSGLNGLLSKARGKDPFALVAATLYLDAGPIMLGVTIPENLRARYDSILERLHKR